MSENQEIVYLFGYSPRTTTKLQDLIPIIKGITSKGRKVGIILIHDGVIGCSTKGRIPISLQNLLALELPTYAMIPDLKARGIEVESINDDIKPIEYSELVDILDSTPKIISWM